MADPGSELVIQRINRYIDATYNPAFTIAENLDAAQVRAMNDRKGSHDTEGVSREVVLCFAGQGEPPRRFCVTPPS